MKVFNNGILTLLGFQMMTKFERIVREKCGTYLYSLKYVRSLDVILDLTLFDIAKYIYSCNTKSIIWMKTLQIKFTQDTFFDIFVNTTNIILFT